ncbi:GUN4 domain-containing protein [Cyanobium sp. ATX 6F1]|uniref:GUN4 domain-containing protein n=1 Tax=unclassified Cyanobium TaxID=2627006 RepID=UPI0020CC4588|nr:GUN4 domain-containing protein [Cyanobium sp. ATX 6F1]MCP9917680.1 GUN4 domain-containing protein [Cyanobium sp. ATX 6F1]
MTDPGEQRVAALEAALAALSRRLETTEAQLREHEACLSVVSDVVRFAKLRELLAQGRFNAADRETTRVLYDYLGSTVDEITPEAIEACPGTPLQIIDRLWRDASGSHYGFSAQLRIYRSLGGSLETLIAQDGARFRAFCGRVGWDPNGLLADPDDAAEAEAESPAAPEADATDLPEGALPRRWWSTPYGMKIGNIFMARLITAGFDDATTPVAAPAPSG